ncbi:rRNA maturation RNase YbeY [Flavobacteriaceae bacterium 3-367]
MIEYHYQTDFKLEGEKHFTDWITRVIKAETRDLGPLAYIFCSDESMLEMNKKYLDHDTFTDIITFDYTEGEELSGDIFISTDRLRENAATFGVSFREEVLRVMVHGVLHLMGYKDKTDEDKTLMRNKENEMIALFHVEH